MGVEGCTVWFGGLSAEVIAEMDPRAVADGLDCYGKIDRVEMKKRCFLVTMKSAREAARLCQKKHLTVLGHSAVVCMDESATTKAPKEHHELASDAARLLKKIKADNVKGLDLHSIEEKLRSLPRAMQVKAVKTYMGSDPREVRNPTGWFSSIIRTLSVASDGSTVDREQKREGHNRQKRPQKKKDMSRSRSVRRKKSRSHSGSSGSSHTASTSSGKKSRSEPKSRKKSGSESDSSDGSSHSNDSSTSQSETSSTGSPTSTFSDDSSSNRSKRKFSSGGSSSSSSTSGRSNKSNSQLTRWDSTCSEAPERKTAKKKKIGSLEDAMEGWQAVSKDDKKAGIRKVGTLEETLDGWQKVKDRKDKNAVHASDTRHSPLLNKKPQKAAPGTRRTSRLAKTPSPVRARSQVRPRVCLQSRPRSRARLHPRVRSPSISAGEISASASFKRASPVLKSLPRRISKKPYARDAEKPKVHVRETGTESSADESSASKSRPREKSSQAVQENAKARERSKCSEPREDSVEKSHDSTGKSVEDTDKSGDSAEKSHEGSSKPKSRRATSKPCESSEKSHEASDEKSGDGSHPESVDKVQPCDRGHKSNEGSHKGDRHASKSREDSVEKSKSSPPEAEKARDAKLPDVKIARKGKAAIRKTSVRAAEHSHKGSKKRARSSSRKREKSKRAKRKATRREASETSGTSVSSRCAKRRKGNSKALNKAAAAKATKRALALLAAEQAAASQEAELSKRQSAAKRTLEKATKQAAAASKSVKKPSKSKRAVSKRVRAVSPPSAPAKVKGRKAKAKHHSPPTKLVSKHVVAAKLAASRDSHTRLKKAAAKTVVTVASPKETLAAKRAARIRAAMQTVETSTVKVEDLPTPISIHSREPSEAPSVILTSKIVRRREPFAVRQKKQREAEKAAKEKEKAERSLVSLAFVGPNGKAKHVMHRSETTVREIFQAHGRDPNMYRFLFEGYYVSRDVTVKELEDALPFGSEHDVLTINWEKLIRVDIYFSGEVFEEHLPGSMTVSDLFMDFRARGLEDDIENLSCQNKNGVEYANDLSMATLDAKSGASVRGKPLKLVVMRGGWESD